MIIVDLNQVMLSNLMMQLGNHTNAEIEESMVRHMVLNSLRSYRQKFAEEYGEMIIACDNTNIWRKKEFPHYKANRKKKVDNSELNWKSIFDCMRKIREELKEFFPYRVIDVETAEADDVIASLITLFNEDHDKILILSSDKDFIQLHLYENVKQYDPVRKKWITHEDPERFLSEHIICGDAGDGVPNILSSDTCFVNGERQKPMTKKRIEQLINVPISDLEEPIKSNYIRNQKMIDLRMIPDYIKNKTLEQYEQQKGKKRDKLVNYFIGNRLRNLLEHISEF